MGCDQSFNFKCITMTPEDSRKIAQAMQEGIFIKLDFSEQMKIRDMIAREEINSYDAFISYLQKE